MLALSHDCPSSLFAAHGSPKKTLSPIEVDVYLCLRSVSEFACYLHLHNRNYIITNVMQEEELARGIFGLYLPLVECFRKAFAERSRISIGQFRVLALIEFDSVRHVTKLAERNLVSQPAMSKTVDALVQLGYVARTESTEDRRLSELHVTSKGRQAMSAVYSNAAKELVPGLTRLSMQKRKQLAVALDIVTQVLSEK